MARTAMYYTYVYNVPLTSLFKMNTLRSEEINLKLRLMGFLTCSSSHCTYISIFLKIWLRLPEGCKSNKVKILSEPMGVVYPNGFCNQKRSANKLINNSFWTDVVTEYLPLTSLVWNRIPKTETLTLKSQVHSNLKKKRIQ